MSRTLRIVLAIIVLVVVAAAGFAGGMFYGQSRAQAQVSARRATFMQGGGFNDQGTPFPGQGQGIRQGGQGGALFGQIQQIGDNLLVITDNNGAQTQVHVTDTTLIEKNASVTLSDLQTGETVIVSGSKGSDGSITARSIQVAPAGRFGMGGPGQPNATPAP